jgi:hypothetical protein
MSLLRASSLEPRPPSWQLWLSALAAVLLFVLPSSAQDRGPELNPFECYGRAQNAMGSRTISQMEQELARLMSPLFKDGDPASRRAVKACVVGRLKARVGDTDAYDYLKQAIALNPEEPGYELWAGDYWISARGAFRPITQRAEQHLYAALAKLEALREKGRFREHHATVESWVRKRLLVLYQEDGLPLLPWKAYKQDSRGLRAPGLTISSQFAISQDTRDFFRNSEMRIFTAEAAFASSGVRAGGTPEPLTPRQRYDLARAPLRYQVDNRARIRQTRMGAIDVLHSYHKSEKSQITSFYQPTTFNDVTVQELGAAFTREFDLYPAFDMRLHGTYKRIQRTGVVEFLPDHEEEFNFYEIKPSFSRFLGANKLSLNLTYVFMDIPDLPGGVASESDRSHSIYGGELSYSIHAPLVLPAINMGSLYGQRTPTRGWYFWAGFVQSDQVYGLRTVTQRDAYLGTRFEGARHIDLTLQGTAYTSDISFFDPNQRRVTEYSDPTQSFKSMRTTLIVQRRLINPDTMPGVQPSAAGMAADMLNLVVPISWDKALTSPKNFDPADKADRGNDYENVRGGAELWFKLYLTGIGGSAMLFTAGYEAQYFYRLEKTVHNIHGNVRLGWGDFL